MKQKMTYKEFLKELTRIADNPLTAGLYEDLTLENIPPDLDEELKEYYSKGMSPRQVLDEFI